MKFKMYKDAAENTYYKTLDEKFLIMKDEGVWTVWEEKNEKIENEYIFSGYNMRWAGFKKLKDAKGYVEEFEKDEVGA